MMRGWCLPNSWGILVLQQQEPPTPGKELRFFLTRHSVPPPYQIKWKVRNVGIEAERRDEIRGQLLYDRWRPDRIEHTKFEGPHYVECYVLKNGVCVARDRIEVPISN